MRYTIELVRPRAAASVISGQPLIQRYNRAVASLDDTVTLTLQGLAEDATPADIESAYLRVTTTLEITHPSNEPDVPRSPIIKPLGTATFPYKHFRVQRDPTSEEMESRVREELKAMLQKGAISQEMLVYAGQQRLVEGHVYERERPETSRSTL